MLTKLWNSQFLNNCICLNYSIISLFFNGKDIFYLPNDKIQHNSRIFTTKDNQFAILGNSLDDLKDKIDSFDNAFQKNGFWGTDGAFSALMGGDRKKLISPELIDEFKAFSKEFNNSSKSVDVLKEEIGSLSPEIENYAKTQKNGTLSLEGFTKSLNQNTLAAKAGQVALKGLSMAGNMIAFMAIAKVIEVAAIAIDNFIHRTEKAREAFENANSTFESTQAELSSITSELEEQEKALSDLQSKEKLTYAEQGQLEELQRITTELRLQQDILQKQALQAREEVENAAVKSFNTQYNNANISEVNEDQDIFSITNNEDIADVISGLLLARKRLEEVSLQIQQDAENLTDSELESLQYDFQYFTDMISDYEDVLNESLNNLNSLRQSLAEGYNEYTLKQQNGEVLTTDQQDVIDTFQTISDAVRLIYQYTDPNQWNSMQISDILNSDDIEKTKDELLEMVQAGELSADSIEKNFPVLNSAIQQSELFLKDGQTAAEAFVDEISAAAGAEEQLKDGAEEVADTVATISSSVSQIATQLKPQFDELAEAYKEIFSDDGFSIDVVDNEMLENLRSAFEDIEEDVGVSFDTTELNKFFSVLTDGASTADEVQQAFNDLATAYLYSTDTMENLNDETAQAIEQQLQEMGVTNANEVVAAALAQQKLNLGVANLYAAQTGETLANATAADIAAFAAEQVQLGNTNQAMYQVLMQKVQFNLSSINTASDINNLYQLAQAAGATAQTLSALNAAKGRFGTTGSATYDALRARKDVAIAMLNQEKEADIGFEPVEIDFGGSFAGAKDAAGSAGKEGADEYKEQFEKELSSLQDLHERGR